MKLIREHINEKFIQDSDPISDMNIGSYVSKIENIFHEFFDKFGKLSFMWDGLDDDHAKSLDVYIPYKKMYEPQLIANMLYSVYNVNMQKYSEGRWIIGDLSDILEEYGMSIHTTRLSKARTFKKRSSFNRSDKGVIFFMLFDSEFNLTNFYF